MLLGPTESEPAPVAAPSAQSISASLVAPSPHAGQGHFTLGTYGTLSYSTGTLGTSTLSFFANVGAAYFVHDRILVGAHFGLSVDSFFAPIGFGGSATTVGIPFGVFGQY